MGLKVHPFLIPNPMAETRRRMTLNIPEVLNELSYSLQVTNLQEKEMLTSFTCQCFWISQGDNREIISADMNLFYWEVYAYT